MPFPGLPTGLSQLSEMFPVSPDFTRTSSLILGAETTKFPAQKRRHVRTSWLLGVSGPSTSISARCACAISFMKSVFTVLLSLGCLSLTSPFSKGAQTILSPPCRGAERSCRPHHWSSGSPLVVAPSPHPWRAWLRIALLCLTARHRVSPDFTRFAPAPYGTGGPSFNP